MATDITIFEAIAGCPTLDELHVIAVSDCWLECRQILQAVRERYKELVRTGRTGRMQLIGNGITHLAFGNERFTRAFFGLDTVPDNPLPTNVTIPACTVEQLGAGGNEMAQDSQQQEEHDIEYYYTLTDPQVEHVKMFKTQGTTFGIQFRHLNECTDITNIATNVFEHAISQILKDASGNDKIGLQIQHPALDTPILIPFRNREQITGEIIMAEFERVQQSKKKLKIDDQITITATRIETPAGGVNQRTRGGHWQTWYDQHSTGRGCIVKMGNKNDNLCCPRAIVTGIARLHMNDSPAHKTRYESIRKGDTNRCTVQKTEAKQLMIDAGLANHTGLIGEPELTKLQACLPAYCLKVFFKCTGNELWYRGPPNKDMEVCLYLADGHYGLVTSIAAFHSHSYYCHTCDKPYSNKDKHRCNNSCGRCHRTTSNCPKNTYLHECKDCNMFFPTLDCLDEHRREKVTTIGQAHKRMKTNTSICKRKWFCRECKTMVMQSNQNGEKHICYSKWCSICKKWLIKEHVCWMLRLDEEKQYQTHSNTQPSTDSSGDEHEIAQTADKNSLFVFFDIESEQSERLTDNSLGAVNLHKPILVIAHRTCNICKNEPLTAGCTQCGNERKRIFAGNESLQQFCEWLMKLKGRIMVFAHNLRGFDGSFILKYIHQQGIKPQVIMNGTKIMYMKTHNIQYKDSLNFLPMALSALPKTFGLHELKKGYYPHLFTTPQTMDYIGPLPAIEYYTPDKMKTQQRTDFLNWHREQTEQNKVFNLQKELVDYCESDVTILRQACMQFRDRWIDATGIDPLTNANTIAGACTLAYRKNWLPSHTIALIPEHGYRKEKIQSAIAIKWLCYYAHTHNVYVQHKMNKGEKRLTGTNMHVDGYIDNSHLQMKSIVLEFDGCCWHGCLDCYPNRNTKMPNKRTADECYSATLDRNKQIKREYELVQVWECKIRQKIKTDPQMSAFFNECDVQTVLNPRDAFYGGRTNAVKLHTVCKPGEKIGYIDICSLYPYCQKYKAFPIGLPEVITENFDTLTTTHQPYKGVMKCKVLPPTNLLHPLLPRKSEKKLQFPLCAACGDSRQQTECTHSDAERSWWGTYCTPEIDKALQLGYKVLEISEVYHYTQWMDGSNAEDSLFAPYVDTFLKLKAESSGWPPNVITNEQKADYIAQFYAKECVQLDADNVKHNAGMRQVSKLALNSFWGRFGMRNDMMKTLYFTSCVEYLKFVHDKANVIHHITAVSEDMVLTQYKKEQGSVDVPKNTNVIIACFTTTWARLTLYEYIEKLQDRTLYFDTDSIIYTISPADTYTPKIGSFLGEMTNEVPDGCWITELIATGPKSYAYTVFDPTTEKTTEYMKIRGFTLNWECSQQLQMDEMRRMVLALVETGGQKEVELMYWKIVRLPDFTVVSQNVCKTFKPVYDKRVIQNDGSTLPYGYRKQ